MGMQVGYYRWCEEFFFFRFFAFLLQLLDIEHISQNQFIVCSKLQPLSQKLSFTPFFFGVNFRSPHTAPYKNRKIYIFMYAFFRLETHFLPDTFLLTKPKFPSVTR